MDTGKLDELKKRSDANRARALEDYQVRTKTVSDLMKYLGYGLLAAFYTVRGEINALSSDNFLQLAHIGIGISGVLVILSDYLHNLFAARTALNALNDASSRHRYNRRSGSYRISLFFYYAKQASTAIGSALL